MKYRNRALALLISLVMVLTFMPLLAFAEDDPIDFYGVTENTSGSYMFELNNQECFINVNSVNDLVFAGSSDEGIVKIKHLQNNGGGSWEIAVDPVGLGKTTITVKDTAGNTKSCSVEVKEGIFFYAEDEVSFSVAERDPYLYIHAYDLNTSDFESTNTEVASVSDAWSMGAGRYICTLDLHKCGETTISVQDNDGRTASVKLIVTESDWELNKDNLEFEVSDGYEAWDALKIVLGKDYPELNVTSSDESVVTAFMDGYDVALELQGAGEADITVSDNYGKSRICHVIVNPDPPTPFGFTTNSYKFVYDSDCDYYTPEEKYFNLIDECVTTIESVSVDNEGVVEIENESGGLLVRPIGLGEAVITATDEQGLTATIKISVVEEIFLDQSYFGSTNASDPGSYDSQAVYGDTALYCHCNVDGTVASCKVGPKTYKGTIKNGECTIKIPRITTKTISVKFTNGDFSYTSKATVEKKKAAFVKATAASVTYNGKAQTPKVTVKDGSYTLIKGTDYTVTYRNNTKVGTGTATIKLKGNYTGMKTAKFDVRPKGTTIVSLVAVKKAFTVKWKRNTAVNGYDIEYSNQKNFKNVATAKPKDAETIRYTRNSVTSRKFTGLVSGRTYYVRVRTYKKVNGKYIYSTWGTVKKIKVK